jgi:hypothetical protein
VAASFADGLSGLADDIADNNASCARRHGTTCTASKDEVNVPVLGRVTSSHRRGHWFDPSIAHQRQRPFPIFGEGR